MARFANLFALTLSLAWWSNVAQAYDARPGALRVMSFNIRFGTAADGPNHWDHRRDHVVSTIRACEPDLLGTQETLPFQRDYLAAKLPEYEPFAAGREDGKEQGEMTALFYRRDRFERLEGGHFWLSETPEVPGSKSWDTSLPRVCSWVKLRDRSDPQQRVLWFFNTHFDHRGREARNESAKLLNRRITEQCGDDRVVVTGDFNAAEGSDPYRFLFAPLGDRSPLIDTYRAAHPERRDDEGTGNGFRPDATTGGRIDWIAQRGWAVESAEIVRTLYDGRTPSDHWPVTAVLRPQ